VQLSERVAPEVADVAVRREDRWAAHPGWAGGLRIAIVLVPLGLSVVAGVIAGRLLPTGESWPARLGWWALIFVVSSVVLFVSDRIGRRLLPLAVLLELSLVFPDRAPSRLRSVRTASVRDLEQRLARLRSHGATTPPMEAAETLVTLVGVLGLHDKRTRGHSERVRAYVDLLTDEMGLSEEERSQARWAALVHDMGKLTVPAKVLNKASGLDEDEWVNIRRHPEEGVRLVAGLLPWLGEWGHAIGEHHERWDGTGYPAGLAGEDIALAARVLAVADSYEVMTSSRSYSRARSASVARKELTACAGTQFDPLVVRHFLSISLGRLRWVLGPVSWLAEAPLLALERTGQLARIATGTLGAGALVVTGVVAAPAVTAAPPATHGATTSAASPAAALSAAAPEGQTRSGVVARRAAVTPSLPRVAPSPQLTPSPARAATSLRATARRSGPSAPAPAPAPGPARAPAPAPARQAHSAAPPTYWFALGPHGYTFTTSAPSRSGVPDQDADGHPGRTLVPTPDGLDASRAAQRIVLTAGLSRTLRLDGAPSVVLWSRLARGHGNARIEVRLLDCSANRCTTLSEGHVEDGTWSRGTSFGVHEVPLSRVTATVPKGHRLRLVVVANDAGTSGNVWVGLGSRSVPSRLVLPVA
jgi:hypothetical protein